MAEAVGSLWPAASSSRHGAGDEVRGGDGRARPLGSVRITF